MELRYCMHAGGEIDGRMLLNTLDGYMLWKKKGVRIYEYDIVETVDNEYIACHDYSIKGFEQLGICNIPSFHNCTKDWFKTSLINTENIKGLHTLDLNGVLNLLNQPDVDSIMIDPKTFSYESCRRLLKKISFISDTLNINHVKIVFETYNPDMIKAASESGLSLTWQYCVDDDIQQGNSKITRDMETEELISFLKESNINVISYPWKQAVENLPKLKRFKDEGFVIYSRTRNDLFYDLLIKAGIDINIVDHLLTDEKRKDLESYRTLYLNQYKKSIDTYFQR